MITIIISAIILYLLYTILVKVLYEDKTTSLFFSIILSIGISLFVSTLLVPKEHTSVKYGVNELIIIKKLSPFKTNTDIIEGLEKIISSGKDTLVIETIRYKSTSNHYLRTPYPKKSIEKIVNRNNTYLK